MARPTIVGTILREIYMNHASSTSNKDYRIIVSKDSASIFHVYREHGPTGRLRNGDEYLKAGPITSERKANSIASDLCATKEAQRDAYAIVFDRRTKTPPSSSSPSAASTPPKQSASTRLSALSESTRKQIHNFF